MLGEGAAACPGLLGFRDRHGYTLLVFTMPEEDNPDNFYLRVQASVVQLLSRTKEALGLTASAGICAGTGCIGEMSELYAQACRALQERIVYGQDIAIPYREQERKQQGVQAQPGLEKALEIALDWPTRKLWKRCRDCGTRAWRWPRPLTKCMRPSFI